MMAYYEGPNEKKNSHEKLLACHFEGNTARIKCKCSTKVSIKPKFKFQQVFEAHGYYFYIEKYSFTRADKEEHYPSK